MKKIYISISIIMALFFAAVKEAGAWIIFTTDIPGANDALSKAFTQYMHQPKLAKGFANASAYSSQVATQRGFQGYDKFAITLGTMAGVQVPNPTSDLSYYKHLQEKLRRQGDVTAGVAWNAWALNAGVRLPGDFYLSAKFGKLKYSYLDFDFDGMTLGGMLNYQLIKQWSPPVKIFLWRGLSIGTGFLWQYNKTAYHYKGSWSSYGPPPPDNFIIQPKLKILFKTESYVIPIELSTAIRLFWFLNLQVGGGIDFALGSSRINYSSIGYYVAPSGIGLYSVYGRQSGTGPTRYMPKVFCGPGLSLGPVIVDVPFTFYFTGGFNVGVTVGIVW